ncbi:hypothetical protein DEM34_10135 [Spiribacter halobius]|uniref:O-antigen ligase domain-containing protein n=2 Tax=Sediminicurvatus halobius TaxID=2182432 RepID=A0A2U2N1T3_9GAMM|nr:hypothetical protein DEM34_10135 [Spiribacter halobius]
MFLFVLLGPLVRDVDVDWQAVIAYSLVFVGVAFTVRFLWLENVRVLEIGRGIQFGDMRYLPMEPAVTFSAAFGALEAIRALERRRWVVAGWFGFLALVSILPLAAMVVRAPLMLLALVVLFRLAVMMWAPMNWRLVAMISLALWLVMWTFGGSIAGLVLEKFEAVGLNTKGLELSAVFNVVSGSAWNSVFGGGWGSVYLSPAYAEPVRFVHNFPAYMALKAGTIGFVIAVLIVWQFYILRGVMWLIAMQNLRFRDKFKGSAEGACLVALTPCILVQPTFKSLSFGLLLLLTSVGSRGLQKWSSRSQAGGVRE